MIENPRTGEQLEVVVDTPELIAFEATWPAGRARTAAHVHPQAEERWTVRAGRAGFRIGDEELTAGPGETVVAPAGTPHRAWNASADEARVRIELRPALRWREFVERLFAGEDPAALLAEFAREIRPAPYS